MWQNIEGELSRCEHGFHVCSACELERAAVQRFLDARPWAVREQCYVLAGCLKIQGETWLQLRVSHYAVSSTEMFGPWHLADLDGQSAEFRRQLWIDIARRVCSSVQDLVKSLWSCEDDEPTLVGFKIAQPESERRS